MKDKSEPIQFPLSDPIDGELQILLASIEKERIPKRIRELAERLQDELVKRKNSE
jgi:hypothetical protein